MRRTVSTWRAAGERVGLVPTMGALHDGHLSLVRAARRQCERVVTSIFVNPTQFGSTYDLRRYPQTRRRDLELLRQEHCDLVFIPDAPAMYPEGFDTYVVPDRLSEVLEGRSRPGHFRGVATVCLKLFTICAPHVAYFGEKDFQQTVVIRRLIEDLNLDLRLRALPTVREPDGLAMSSRNRFLSETQRRTAACLYGVLRILARDLRRGRLTPSGAERRGRARLRRTPGIDLDYLAVRDARTLAVPEPAAREVVLLVAARLGSVHLIDNVRARLIARP